MNYLANSNANRSWSGPLTELRREMDRLFDDFWSAPMLSSRMKQVDSPWNPACDVEEGDGHYLINVEMAGVPRDQIQVEVHDNQLVVSGERRHESSKKENGLSYSERRFGRFQRSFALPAGVDADKVEANYQDGILRLYVPKAESARPRQVKITHGSGTGFFGKLLGQTPKEKEELHSSSADRKVS